MPRYRSHKEVAALKIGPHRTVNPDGSWTISFEDESYVPVTLASAVCERHSPQPGDYLVIYADGYQSISPGDVFEAGYTRITDG